MSAVLGTIKGGLPENFSRKTALFEEPTYLVFNNAN